MLHLPLISKRFSARFPVAIVFGTWIYSLLRQFNFPIKWWSIRLFYEKFNAKLYAYSRFSMQLNMYHTSNDLLSFEFYSLDVLHFFFRSQLSVFFLCIHSHNHTNAHTLNAITLQIPYMNIWSATKTTMNTLNSNCKHTNNTKILMRDAPRWPLTK